MSALDWALFVAAYAASISSIALGWNIVSSIRKSQGKLKVDYSFSYGIIEDYLGRPAKNTVPYLAIRITNIGKSIRHINRLIIQLPREIDGWSTFGLGRVDDSQKFPHKLNPGELFERELNLIHFQQRFMEILRQEDNFRIVVWDTLGKKYRSSKIRVKSVVHCIQAAQESD